MSPHRIEDLYELAPIQEGMLYHSLRSPSAGVYVEQRSLVLEGDLDAEAFEAAWRHVVERHPVLRTAFQWEELEKPLQVVYRRVDPVWERRDWRGLEGKTQTRRWERLLDERRGRGFALDQAPLLALTLARLEDRVWRFGFAFHHALIDGWSLPLVLEEVLAAYRALAAGRRPALPRPRPYRDFILWLQRRDPADDERFWRRRLEGFTHPTPLPAARPRSSATAEDRPGRLEIVDRTVTLSEEATAGLGRFARARGLTQSTLLQGAWALMLARLTGEDDVVFGVTVSGRPPELEGHATMVGVFINTLPLRAGVDPEERLGGWLDRLQRRQAEAQDHQHTSLGSVQAWSDAPAGRALFETILVFENLRNATGTPETPRGGLGADLVVRDVSGTSRTNYPLTLVAMPGSRLRLIAACDAARVDPEAMARHLGQMETLLESFSAPGAAERRLGDLPLLDGAERALVLEVWGGRQEVEPAVDGSLDERFRALAAARPDAVAVVDGPRRVSYGELAARADRLARRLAVAGVSPGEPVALVAERSAELVAAILGILQVGGFYVPLDPRHPAERHALVLGDSGARVLVSDPASLDRLDTGDLRVLVLDGEDGANTPEAAPALPVPHPDRLAYVIYTSGSTGRPKGVPVTHRSVLRLLDAAAPLTAAGPDDAWTFFHSFAFDFSVWEIWGALTTGGRVVVVPYWTARSPEELHRLLAAEGVTVLNQTPSAFGQLVRVDRTTGAGLDDLRLVIFGGEALEPPMLAPWIERHGAERPRLVNMYGITETTIHVTHRTLTARDLEPAAEGGAGRSPIGRALPHLVTRVLDRRMQPVPPRVWGEIHVGGAGLTHGYLGRPGLTAERFVPDPFADRPGQRLYKSGDLARWTADGPAGPELVYGGRIDHQVQVRGFRVELGEVEGALVEQPGVAEAVVVSRIPPSGADDGPVLVAYVVATPDREPGATWGEELRRRLGSRLPEPMIPARIVPLDALPLTVNGKVDRSALPEAFTGVSGPAPAAEPGGPMEQAIADLWQSVLGGARPGAHDDFFAAGGHSLLATRLVSRLGATFDVRLPLATLFDHPTVAGVARAVEEAWRERSDLDDLPLEGGMAVGMAPVPLSFAQERLWFLDRLEPERVWYNIPLALSLSGPLDLTALGRALAALVGRHEVLRTRFPERRGEPFQEILESSEPLLAPLLAVPVVDLCGLHPDRRDAETARLAADVVGRPFELAAAPPVRWSVLRRHRGADGTGEHVLLASLHHILADAWSIGLLVHDLTAVYEACRHGRVPSPEPVAVTYGDFAVWERRRASHGVFDRLLAAAAERLEGASHRLDLPTDRPRPAVRRGRGARLPVAFDRPLSEGLAALCRDQGATLFMGLVATFAAALARSAGRGDLLLGTPVAGRNRPALEGLMGVLVNTLVLRAELGDDPSLRQLLDRVRADSLAAFQQQDLPFERLVERLDPERAGGRTPLFQVMLVLQNAPAGRLELGELALAPLQVSRPTARFEMLASLGEAGGRLGGGIEYDAELFDATTVARLLEAWTRAVVVAVAEPDVPLSRLSLLSPAQVAQVTREWSGGGLAADALEPVHLAILSWAERSPKATAVVCGDTELTYRQLARRAGALAADLRRRGVRPGARVGLVAERSAESLVGLLGILLAGAAYVPLEPAGAPERLAFQLADAGTELLVAPGAVPEPPPGVGVVPVPVAGAGEDPPARPQASPRSLAYVIYTSGSTGRPKGVEVEHRQLAAYLAGVRRRLAVPDGMSWATVTTLAADLGNTSIFAALTSGGALHVVPEEEIADAEALARRLAHRPVDCLKVVPSHLAALVAGEAARDVLPRRLLVFGGEALPPSLVDRVRALAPELAVVNHYGPTETTVGVAAGAVEAGHRAGGVSLGRPLAFVRVAVTDRTLRPAPVGAVGQLVVGGPQVARGYAGRPTATAERFVPDPFGPEPGGRLYLTGDLGRFLADGRLALTGRLDDQVKIRGFRVEPGELAAVLGEHPGVDEAVVVVRRLAGGPELVACYVPRAGAEPDPRELSAHLARRLPPAVRPSRLVALDGLPLTVNGKLDRRALEARVEDDAGRGPSAEGPTGPAPRGWLEELVAGVWAEVLGTAPAGVEQSFFELGGHSLLATRVISRLRAALGVEMPLAALFEEPTVAGLAERARRLRAADGAASPAPPLEPVPRPAEAFEAAGTTQLPLSFGQRRLWFLDRLEGAGAAYLIPIGLDLEGPLAAAALGVALTRVTARHEVLRTSFPPGTGPDGEPAQRIARPAAFPLPVVDLEALGEGRARQEADRLQRRAAGRPFDLARGPLVRGLLVALGPAEHRLLVTLHHVVSDGWSRSVMTRELGAFYRAATAGDAATGHQAAGLPALPIQYADYAAWQRRRLDDGGVEREIEHWRRRLADVPRLLPLPTDRPRTAEPGSRGDTRSIHLSPAETGALVELARRSGATLFMGLLAAFSTLLARRAGVDLLAVGTPVAGRHRLETENLIGFFLNTLALRVDLGGGPSFGGLLERVRHTALEAHDHQELPFERLVEELEVGRDLSRSPLFQAMLVLQNAGDGASLELPGLEVRRLPMATGAVRLDLTLVGIEKDGGLHLGLDYRSDLFDGTHAERLLGELRTLVGGAVADPDRPVWALPLLAAGEEHQVLVGWNDRPSPSTGTPAKPLLERFAAAVERHRDLPAVRGPNGETWTYGELARRSARGAALLGDLWAAEGVSPEDRLVGIALDRRPEALAAILAVLESGAAYLPLDPGYPPARLATILDDARPSVVWTHRRFADALPRADGRWTTLLVDDEADDQGDDATPADTLRGPTISASALAYVLYTSGSTGVPKGVAVSRGALDHYLDWVAAAYPLAPGDRVLVHTPLGFDLTVTGLLGPLLGGGVVEMVETVAQGEGPAGGAGADAADAGSGAELLETLAERLADGSGPIAYVKLTPSHLEGLDPLVAVDAAVDVGGLVVGGEPVRGEQLAPWRRRSAELEIFNEYGPTEATVGCVVHRLPPGPPAPGPTPIGRPLSGTRVLVVDRRLRPVPAGVLGELLVAGPGLARGYLGRPSASAERFVPDPSPAAAPGARVYRTGDLVRHRPDGALEFAGRIDRQVKVRGHRIEPAEIERALEALDGVRRAVVSLHRADGEPERLVAWVVRADGKAPLAVEELRSAVLETSPAAAVPSAWVAVDTLPLDAHGKVDFAALPEPVDGGGGAAGGAPRGPVETLVAGVWSEVLGRREVGRADDFFRLGGHSLLATRVVARLRDVFGLEVPVRALFERPTIAGLAGWVEAHRGSDTGGVPPLLPLPRDPGTDLPASFGQERLWFLQRLDPASSVYNMPIALTLDGALDVLALAVALDRVRERHEVLRTRLVETADGLVQRIDPSTPADLPLIDLVALEPPIGRAEAEGLARREAERPFDLGADVPVRPLLVRLGADAHVLLLTLHHAAADGGSVDLLRRELLALYEEARGGEQTHLRPLPVQFADFAAWQRSWLVGDALDEEIDAWRRLLDGFPPVLDLPLDHPRPLGPGGHGARVRRRIGADTRRRVEEIAAAGMATPFMVLLAAYAVVLSRWCRQEAVVVGTPVANRDRVETEHLIGFFANTLAVPVAVGTDTPFDEVVARVRRVVLDVHDHRHTPFDRLVEELVDQRHPGTSPLFQVLFVYVADPGADPAASGDVAIARPFGDDRGSARFDLTLVVSERGDHLSCHVDFSRALFEPATVESLLDSFRRLVEAAVAEPARPISHLPLQSDHQRRDLLARRQALEPETVAESLHGPIVRWTERTPEAPAVVFDDGVLTYGELGRRSAQLAADLRRHGVGGGPDGGPPVALLVERSAGAIVGLVAVLRAGAPTLALDPEAPDERLAAIVVDAGARVLLAAPGLVGRAANLAGGADLEVIPLAVDAEVSAEPAPELPPVPFHPSRSAYVVYTSGTTGGAKGVVVSHGAASTFVHRFAEAIDLDADDRLLLFAPLSFDASVLQIFPVLTRGGALAVHRRPRELAGLPMLGFVDRHRLTVLDLPAALWRQWVEEVAAAGRPVPASLRLFLTGGESVPVDRLDRWARWMLTSGRAEGRFLSSYGPTEATVTATAFQVAARDVAGLDTLDARDVVPLGDPLPHVACHLLDPRLEPVPPGMLGEIHLGGPSVARGYVGRPGETAERFVPDPFGPPGGRLYATGDLARTRADGSLEFAGRVDQQVKVRGFRIELGEVEAALASHPGVGEAAARVDDDGRGGRSLVAWVVAGENGPAPTAGDLRRHLAERLPEVMVPARVVLLDSLPVSASGKLDRRALPAPSAETADGAGGRETPLRTGVQEVLAEIWSGVLGGAVVGPQDDFFDLGGHSLLATQVVSRVREALGVELDLRRMFEAPVLGALAEEVEELQRSSRGLETPPVAPRPPDLEPLPLSHAQKRLYFLDRVHTGTASYNIPALLALDGPLDLAALAGALGRVVARHEVLRTTYHPGGDPQGGLGEPVQRVETPQPVPLPVVDLANLPAEGRAPVARRLLEASAGRGFDLERGPVLRCLAVRLAARSHQLAFVIHHVAADGWSMGVLVREIQTAYTARVTGRSSPLEPLPVQYADYALWERRLLSGDTARALDDYWRRRLAGAPRATEIPGVRPRPARQSDRGAQHARTVDGELAGRLRELGRERAATLFMVLAAGLQVLVHARTGATDIVLGTDMANRTRAETEGLIGFFINQMPLRVDLSDGPSFGALVERVRDEALEGYAHQELPFDRLVDLLDLPPDPSRSPLFQIKLVLQNVPAEGLELPELRLRALEPEATTSQLDFNLRVAERPGGLVLSAQYSTDLYDQPFVERLLRELETLLAVAADDPRRSVAELVDAVRDAEAARRQERETELARSGLAKLRGRRRSDRSRTPPEPAATTKDPRETDDEQST